MYFIRVFFLFPLPLLTLQTTGNACCEFLSSILNSTWSAFCPTPDSFPWAGSSPRTRGVNTFVLPQWVGSSWAREGAHNPPLCATAPTQHPLKPARAGDTISPFTRPPSSSCNQNWQASKTPNFLWRLFCYFSSLTVPPYTTQPYIHYGWSHASKCRLNYFHNKLSVVTPRSLIGHSFTAY